MALRQDVGSEVKIVRDACRKVARERREGVASHHEGCENKRGRERMQTTCTFQERHDVNAVAASWMPED